MNGENRTIKMICNKCGNVIDNGGSRCPYCGNEIDKESVFRFKGYQSSREKAEKIIDSPDEVDHILRKLERKLSDLPMAGGMLAYIPTFVSMLRSYIRQEYTALPIGTAISVLSALIYVLLPFDLIPDFIPGLGLLDDALVLTTVMAGVKADVDAYLRWRDGNR